MLCYVRVLIALTFVTISGCSALTPLTTALTIGDVAKKVHDTENPPPSTVEEVSLKSDINSKVNPDEIEAVPLPSPNFDSKKALTSIPWWMYAIVIVSGIITLINSVRLYLYRRKQNDTSGTDNDGRRSSDGRSVQVHGPSAEEQAETDGNDDGRSATESGSSEREPRVRISFGRRSSGSSWKR